MDITRSILSERNRALLGGDYDSYHAQTSRKIHKLRKRLGVATPKGRKYTSKSAITAENVAQNQEWVQLLITSSERAWANAMAMKSNQSAENTQKPMPGSTKRRIVSRLRKAISYAENLVSILQDRSTSKATAIDDLEANAYLSLLKGGLAFEKSQWKQCLKNYSITRLIYDSLGSTSKTEIYKDLLSSTVDPSIRYASYQLEMPRTKSTAEIAVQSFPRSETNLESDIKSVNPQAFEVGDEVAPSATGPKDVPSTITWRSRKVKLEDASISQALGITKEKVDVLSEKFAAFRKDSVSAKDLVASYDDVLTAQQDAADATKSAIDELVKEGVDPGDPKMQSLQITRTAVNFAVIEWRIGRNRLLCGSQDGLTFEPEKPKQSSKPRKGGKQATLKEERTGRKLSRLRERVALHDSILQSLDAIKELPGVMADTEFLKELDVKKGYFRALKCLAIGRSHSIIGNAANALALYAKALDLAQESSLSLSSSSSTTTTTTTTKDTPPKLELSPTQLQETVSHLKVLVTQHHALADLNHLSSSSTSAKTPKHTRPLLERLHQNQYEENVDLTNLVNYPPKLQPIPVKPIFFDLAWNYIQYPGHKADAANGLVSRSTAATKKGGDEVPGKEDDKPKGRGWFGFGR